MMSASSPVPSKPSRTWMAYRIRGANATWLGHVQAANRATSARRDHRRGGRLQARDRGRALPALPRPAAGYFDIRDLAQVIAHAGPLPHPAQDGAQ